MRLSYKDYLKPDNSWSRLYSDIGIHNYVYENEFLLNKVKVKRWFGELRLFNSWHPNLVCSESGTRRTKPRYPEYRLKWPGIRRTKKGGLTLIHFFFIIIYNADDSDILVRSRTSLQSEPFGGFGHKPIQAKCPKDTYCGNERTTHVKFYIVESHIVVNTFVNVVKYKRTVYFFICRSI